MTESAVVENACTMPVPARQHELLKPFEGKFRAEVKLWMGPGDPVISTGTMTNSWHLGGLYLHQDYIGDPNDGPFPAFEGKGYWGFNTTSGKYEGFWIDNASTTMQMEAGDVDASGKVWTMSSETTSPQSRQLLKKRNVIRLIDANRNVMETYFTGADGNEMKCMEISYTRC